MLFAVRGFMCWLHGGREVKDIIGEDGLEGFEEENHMDKDLKGYVMNREKWRRKDSLLK